MNDKETARIRAESKMQVILNKFIEVYPESEFNIQVSIKTIGKKMHQTIHLKVKS